MYARPILFLRNFAHPVIKRRCSTKMRLDGWMNNTIDPEDVNDDDIDGDKDDHEL